MKTQKFLVPFSFAVILVFIATMSFGCYNPPEDHSTGKYVKEERSVKGFSALDIGGAFEVLLTQGDAEKLVLEADEGEMADIITEVVGDKLKIYMKPGWKGNYHDMKVYLTFKSLDYMEFSGAVEITSQSALSFGNLKMDVSGAAEMDLEFTADKLDAEFSGASEIAFRGKCTNGYFELSGASEMDAEQMEFTNLTLDISGAADALVFATGELNIDASGASTIRHKGGAKLSVDVSGASSVKAM